MILRFSFFLFSFFFFLHADDILLAKKNINFNELITVDKLYLKTINSFKKYNCEPLTLEAVSKEKLLASHYIRKSNVLCTKDVKKFEGSSILFDFGNLSIEKNGQIIYENRDYIKVKKLDGTIEKIYKDGRIK